VIQIEDYHCYIVQKALEYKEMGNVFYKAKDYKKALGKYALV